MVYGIYMVYSICKNNIVSTSYSAADMCIYIEREFEPLVIGASGSITTTAKKLLQVICCGQDDPASRASRCSYEFWLAKISFSLHKSLASEVIVRSSKVNGRQFSASSSFPDSVDIHLEMNG